MEFPLTNRRLIEQLLRDIEVEAEEPGAGDKYRSFAVAARYREYHYVQIRSNPN